MKKEKRFIRFNFFKRKSSSKITKEQIIEYIVKLKGIYDIDYDFAVKAAENIHFTSCNKYSYYHYKTMYTILKSKIDTLSEKEDKLAFLNCLLINNKTLSDTKAFEIAISLSTLCFLSSGLVGALTNHLDRFLNLICNLVILSLYCIELYCCSTKKWKFEKSIYEQLKNEL